MTTSNQRNSTNVVHAVLGATLVITAMIILAVLTQSNETLGTDNFGRALTACVAVLAIGLGAMLLVTASREKPSATLLVTSVGVMYVGGFGLLGTILVFGGIIAAC